MGPRDWGPGAIDSGLIVNAFHAYNLGLRADVFFEYVRSAANPADMPSRDAMGELWDLLGSVGLAQRARDSTRGADRPSLLRHLGRSGGPAVRGSHEPLRPPLPWQAKALRGFTADACNVLPNGPGGGREPGNSDRQPPSPCSLRHPTTPPRAWKDGVKPPPECGLHRRHGRGDQPK